MLQDPFVVVSVMPCWAVPVTTGAAVELGATRSITGVVGTVTVGTLMVAACAAGVVV